MSKNDIKNKIIMNIIHKLYPKHIYGQVGWLCGWPKYGVIKKMVIDDIIGGESFSISDYDIYGSKDDIGSNAYRINLQNSGDSIRIGNAFENDSNMTMLHAFVKDNHCRVYSVYRGVSGNIGGVRIKKYLFMEFDL